MTRNNYNVEQGTGKPNRTPDNSFRSCVFAIVIFIILCIIIMLVTWVMKNQKEAYAIEKAEDTYGSKTEEGEIRGKKNEMIRNMESTELSTSVPSTRSMSDDDSLDGSGSGIPHPSETVTESTKSSTLRTSEGSAATDLVSEPEEDKGADDEERTYHAVKEVLSDTTTEMSTLSSSDQSPTDLYSEPEEEKGMTDEERTHDSVKKVLSNTTTEMPTLSSSEESVTTEEEEKGVTDKVRTHDSMKKVLSNTTTEMVTEMSILSSSEESATTDLYSEPEEENGMTDEVRTHDSMKKVLSNTTTEMVTEMSILSSSEESATTDLYSEPEDEKGMTDEERTHDSMKKVLSNTTTEMVTEMSILSSSEESATTDLYSEPEEGKGVTDEERTHDESTVASSRETEVSSRKGDDLTTPAVTETEGDTSVYLTDHPEDTTTATTVASVKTSHHKGAEICDKVECHRLAGRMLIQKDHQSNPCDNFYMYACGGLQVDDFVYEYDYSADVWKRILREIKYPVGSRPEVFKKMETFFKSCKNTIDDSKKWVQEVLADLNGYGAFNINDTSFNFTALFMGLIKRHYPLVFDIILEIDEEQSDNYALKMTVPIYENPFFERSFPSCMSRNNNLNSAYDSYYRCLQTAMLKEDISALKGAFRAINETDFFISEQHAASLIFDQNSFHDEISATAPTKPEQKYALLNKDFIPITVENLQMKYPLIEWKILLQSLVGHGVEDKTKVHLYFEKYFDNVFEILKDSKEEMYNSIVVTYIARLYSDLYITKDNRDDMYCVRVASKLMHSLAASAYLRTFDRDHLREMNVTSHRVFELIKKAMTKRLLDAVWLQEGSRRKLLNKLHSMKMYADGGLQEFTDEKFLNQQMDGVTFSEDNYMKNALSLVQHYRKTMYDTYHEETRNPKNIWQHFVLPQDVKAVSIYGLNSIVLPLGMMAMPFYSDNYPEYLIIAGLGNVIAHEVAHQFDNRGIYYNSKGERTHHTPFSSSEMEYFLGMKDCFNEEYFTTITQETEEYENVTFKLNPTLVEDENLADDIAAALVHDVVNSLNLSSLPLMPNIGLPNEQVFYTHLAQTLCSKSTLHSEAMHMFESEHLPSLLRVNHITSHSKGFAETFGCKERRKKMCEVFPSLTTESRRTVS